MQFKKATRPLLIFSIVANVLMLIAPLHMLQVYDRILTSGSRETLLYITGIAIFCLAVYGVAEAIRTILAQRIATRYAVKCAEPMFSGMTNGSIPVDQSSEIIRNFHLVQNYIASRSFIGLFDLPFSPIFLVLLYLLHFQLGVVTTFGLGLLIAVAWLNKTTTASDQEKANQTNHEAANFAAAMVNRSEDIHAMGLLPSLVQRWGSVMGASLNAKEVSTKKAGRFLGISKATRQILQVTIMGWGAWLVLNGDMSGGMIFAASMISQRALQPVEQVIAGWDSINRARSANASIQEVLKTATQGADKIPQPAPKGVLQVNNLSFSVGENQILTDINFSAEPGQLVVLVGPSGAGKSTIARIIAGAADATGGEVMLDGCHQNNWPVEQWGQNVGYVAQDIMLFPGTIAENIARMETHPDESRVIQASSAAGAHELINSFPDGYMTRIGSDGVRLSGGQKQRIALARALYTNPKLLILDEPNAHLDREGERILMQSLLRIKQSGATILVVTQRQQILQVADKVMVIQNGKQMSFGNGPVNAAGAGPRNKKPAPGVVTPVPTGPESNPELVSQQ